MFSTFILGYGPGMDDIVARNFWSNFTRLDWIAYPPPFFIPGRMDI